MTPWQRLDPRMLLVGPVQALRQLAFPAILALVGLSSSRGGVQWWAVPVIVLGVLVMGAVPWLSTRFRIDAEQFQLRTGLVQRRVLTAPLDRVRSVDLESSLLHRLLGLTKVKVGTGVDESTIELNALAREQAEALQRELLARRAVAVPPTPVPDLEPDSSTAAPASVPIEPEQVLATLDWSWLRFAPLNLARLAVVAGAVGALSQLLNDVPVLTADRARSTGDSLLGLGWPLLVAVLVVLGLLVWVVVSTAGYALQWAGLRLVRSAGTVRLTAGLLTTRSVSIEESRIRGVELVEPALMRAVGGGELRALATGVSGGTIPVLPPSPLAENQRVGATLLTSPEALTTALSSHGPRARRRAHVRHQVWTLDLTALATFLTWWRDWPLWVPVAVLLVLAPLQALAAELEWRHRGHALTRAHLVSGSGALARRRTVLERDGVIGWVVRQTYFQRRAGLATLVATTAAGGERVEIVDVPYDAAVAVAAEVTPGAVGDFLQRA